MAAAHFRVGDLVSVRQWCGYVYKVDILKDDGKGPVAMLREIKPSKQPQDSPRHEVSVRFLKHYSGMHVRQAVRVRPVS